MSFEDQQDSAADWLLDLYKSRPTRLLIQKQTDRFYFRRKMVEYAVKATITASIAVALLCGGPPAWIFGGAAMALGLSTLVLSRFHPSQYIDEPLYESKLHVKPVDDVKGIEAYRDLWLQRERQHRYDHQLYESKELMWYVGVSMVGAFALFACVSSSVTLPMVLTLCLCLAAMAYKTHQQVTPYVEPEEELNTWFAP